MKTNKIKKFSEERIEMEPKRFYEISGRRYVKLLKTEKILKELKVWIDTQHRDMYNEFDPDKKYISREDYRKGGRFCCLESILNKIDKLGEIKNERKRL